MLEKFKEKLVDYTEYPVDQINENTEIARDLEIDSLNIMIIVGDLEDEYGIHFEVEDIKGVTTVGDFVKVLEQKVACK